MFSFFVNKTVLFEGEHEMQIKPFPGKTISY